MSVSDFTTLVSYPVQLFNALIGWWGSISIGGFTLWQWILSFLFIGIGIAVLHTIIGSAPSVGVASAVIEKHNDSVREQRRADYLEKLKRIKFYQDRQKNKNSKRK